MGPVQWDGDASAWPLRLPPGADYPAAQAAAAGSWPSGRSRRPGSAEPDALWRAARGLRTATPLGPFAIDAEGRQVAHSPAIVRWDEGPDGPAPGGRLATVPSGRVTDFPRDPTGRPRR